MEAHGTSVCCRDIPLARAVNAAAALNIDALDQMLFEAITVADIPVPIVDTTRVGPSFQELSHSFQDGPNSVKGRFTCTLTRDRLQGVGQLAS